MATSDGARRYRGSKPFQLSYPEGWSLREDAGTVSLWKTEQGGAVTICIEEGVGDALRHCTLFAEKTGLEGAKISGDARSAEAVFDTEDGGWCRARILALGPRMLLATYHTRTENAAEEDEVEAIFATLAIA